MSQIFVAILMGSDSDYNCMSCSKTILDKFSIASEVVVTSAHRTPEETRHYVQDAEQRGCELFIAGAGMAAHLAGAVAAHSTRPVLGVPINNGPLQGFDALLSTVQMPPGIPVGTLAIGAAGAKNAGYLAAQILALKDPALAQALKDERAEQAAAVAAKNVAIKER